MSITEPIDSWLSAERDRWEHAVIRVPMCQPAKPVRGDMRAPRQHRRLHDGPTLYDPDTGMRVHDVPKVNVVRATHDPRTWLAASK